MYCEVKMFYYHYSRIVTAVLLLYYHRKELIESTRCRPILYRASHVRRLSFLLKIITFCLCVGNSSSKICVFQNIF